MQGSYGYCRVYCCLCVLFLVNRAQGYTCSLLCPTRPIITLPLLVPSIQLSSPKTVKLYKGNISFSLCVLQMLTSRNTYQPWKHRLIIKIYIIIMKCNNLIRPCITPLTLKCGITTHSILYYKRLY